MKKITMHSRRGSDEMKFKEGDELRYQEDSDNKKMLLFFSDKALCYKSTVAAFDNCKASALGEFVASKLKFEQGQDEKCIFMKSLDKYDESHNIIFIFQNGKAVKVPLTAYETKANRTKLVGAYSSAAPIAAILYEEEPFDIMIVSDANNAITINSSLIPTNATRTSRGVTIFELKKGSIITEAHPAKDCPYENPSAYRRIKVPAKGIKM